MLDLSNLCKSYHLKSGTVDALRDVSLRVGAGEFVSVQGPSGCGKSTLLAIAGALQAPDSGGVRIDNRDPYALAPDARAKFRAATIGFVFQQFHLVPYLDVLDNILAPALAVPLPDARERARELIAQFGLEGREHHVPARLSTGERQRAALARALLSRPKLILADEPTGNLDEQNGRAVLECLAGLARNGTAVLLVTHDTKAAAEFTGRTLRLSKGAVAGE
jgi:ABC-type lipoprotein export system ATPase subunit